MKLKALWFSVLIFVFVTGVFAGERDFEIEVSLEDTSISKISDEILAKVKITNKAKENLKTEGLGSIEFNFSKCLNSKNCVGSMSNFNTMAKIPEKSLRQNESVDFEFDLMQMKWVDKTSSYYDINGTKNFRKVVPKENIYLQASIKLLKGYKNFQNKKIPIYNTTRSNVITVVIE